MTFCHPPTIDPIPCLLSTHCPVDRPFAWQENVKGVPYPLSYFHSLAAWHFCFVSVLSWVLPLLVTKSLQKLHRRHSHCVCPINSSSKGRAKLCVVVLFSPSSRMNNFIMIVLYRNHRSLLLYLLPDNYCVSLCWCTCSRLLLLDMSIIIAIMF